MAVALGCNPFKLKSLSCVLAEHMDVRFSRKLGESCGSKKDTVDDRCPSCCFWG
jgi:hypothetical protein